MESTGDRITEILRNAKVIDLTVGMARDLPCYVPEDQVFIRTPWSSYEIHGYLSNILLTSDHNGTHCDAPAHFLPGEITLEEMPLNSFIGPCDVLDVRHLSHGEKGSESPVISVDEIREWEKTNGEIRQGEIVLFYTGWSDMYYKAFPEGLQFDRAHPAPNQKTMEYLVERKVKHVGIDAVGLGLMQNDAEPHLVAFKNNMVVTEKLINLGELPPRGAFFIFLPIKVIGSTGGLGRAIAIV